MSKKNIFPIVATIAVECFTIINLQELFPAFRGHLSLVCWSTKPIGTVAQ